MFGPRVRLIRLLDFPIWVGASWFIILPLPTMAMANVLPGLLRMYFPGVASQHPCWTYWLLGLLAALAIFGSLLLHELGLAVVTRSWRVPILGMTPSLCGGVAQTISEPPSVRAEILVMVAKPVVTIVWQRWSLHLYGWETSGTGHLAKSSL